MNILEYSESFQKLCEKRFERLSPRYVVDNVNAGYSRDNVFDILEELADIQSILEILIGRVSESATGEIDSKLLQSIIRLAEVVPQGVVACRELDEVLDSAYRKEDVERVVSRSEIESTNPE